MPKEGCRMTNVTFKTKSGIVYGMIAKGHANYNTEGEDILCASISALTQALVGYLMEIVGSQTLCTFEVDEKKGKLAFIINNVNYADDLRVKTAFDMIRRFLVELSIDDEYKSHLKVEVKEDVIN